jgi:alpha-methylacyl-CoA racemase
LHGVKAVEFAALGPAPMGAMLLADLGAEVVRIERPVAANGAAKVELFDPAIDILNRSRRVLALDLKKSAAIEAALQLIEGADILIEGFRPGVMERLGLGPDACLARNPRLVYGRMTGWGQTGPLAHSAGHDINYLSLSGALHAIGEAGGKPVVPLNLVADCGGGAMLLAFGVLSALVEARTSGLGQVVDAAMTDGSALLMSMMYTLKAMGQWSNERGSNLLDGGAFFYDTYRCADGKYLSLGAIEPQFYSLFLEQCGIVDAAFQAQWERGQWPLLKEKLALVIAQKSRDTWCALFEGTDACVAPVLDLDEAPLHPHNQARGTFVNVNGVVQPAPAPRFSRTPAATPRPPAGQAEGAAILADWGFPAAAIDALQAVGAIQYHAAGTSPANNKN